MTKNRRFDAASKRRPRAGITLGLAGDTMLGRGVAGALETKDPKSLFADEVVAAAAEADLFLLNLECCISDRGSPWPDPGKPFFFRAPPHAVRALTHLGVTCVTLANNHALDFGADALLDTFAHLDSAGIAHTGAGRDVSSARAPVVIDRDGFRVGVVAFTDHPKEFAAGAGKAGVAFANLQHGVPQWLVETVGSIDADAVVVTPHWGPNMNPAPLVHIQKAASTLCDAGASLIAGHSAHVFQGVQDRILYDLGDFLDDYAIDSELRNDLGLLFLVTLDEQGPSRLEAVPLKLEFCHTRLAYGDDAAWISHRFRDACAVFGTDVREENRRLIVERGALPDRAAG